MLTAPLIRKSRQKSLQPHSFRLPPRKDRLYDSRRQGGSYNRRQQCGEEPAACIGIHERKAGERMHELTQRSDDLRPAGLRYDFTRVFGKNRQKRGRRVVA